MRHRPLRPAWISSLAACALPAAAAAISPPDHRTETCVTAECHAGIVQRRVVHAPAGQQKCLACHAYDEPRDHRFVLAGDPEALCLTCHTVARRTFDHAPAVQGRCTACHDPHGSDHPLMLVADPVTELCNTCHVEVRGEGRRSVHGPVAAGACILCHEAHTSWRPALLVDEPRSLCLACHSEMSTGAGRHRYVHEPVENDCLACHDAHASDAPYQLHETVPGLCYTCHGEIPRELEGARVVHGAVNEPGGCTGCHDAHFSALPNLQRRDEVDQCLACHDRPLETGSGRMLTDMAALLEHNPSRHGPIRNGSCSSCHLPHAADEASLLRLAYPPDFYASFDPDRYALCFECHLPDMVESSRGRGLTRFRDGDVNLHWLHVNRSKGRTCRACHEVHASANPFHMRDTVPFGSGGWALEIGFERTEDGGRCAPGCHAVETYDHGDGS